MEFKDQLNRLIIIHKTPLRIISLVPSQTELLCDLGLEASLVGVTKFCIHPDHIKRKATIVGGTKQIHFDKIEALNPDIVLCNKEENTKEIVAFCENICAVHVSDVANIEDSIQLIKQYGAIFNVSQKANFITQQIKSEFECFNTFIKDKMKLKTVYFIWKSPWMVVGNQTFINSLLNLCHFSNYFEALDRYPEIDLNNHTYDDVDLVLLSSEPYPFKERHKIDLQEKFPNAKLLIVDGEMFSWYGSRLIKAFRYFTSLLLNLL